MQNTISSHIITIMKILLSDEADISVVRLASNSNQYFGTIKKDGIELVEILNLNLTNAVQQNNALSLKKHPLRHDTL